MRLFQFILTMTCILASNDCVKAQPAIQTVSNLKITTLSTMLSSKGIGEWGYAALIEVDEKKILFDTGRYPETVLNNAKVLGVDLSDVEDVFLSHNHGDHTGGLLTLRAALKKNNPDALKRVHVAPGIFEDRVNGNDRMLRIRQTLEADGVEIITHEKSFEIFSGVWITGPIERIHQEKNWNGNGKIKTDTGTIEDNIPEDQSLVIHTSQGFVLVSGCGHAGIVNTLEHIKININDTRIKTIIGGFHLMNASDEHLKWTAHQLNSFGVNEIIGSHCTGINSLYTLRELLNLDRETAVVGSVGDWYDLENGITAGVIAR